VLWIVKKKRDHGQKAKSVFFTFAESYLLKSELVLVLELRNLLCLFSGNIFISGNPGIQSTGAGKVLPCTGRNRLQKAYKKLYSITQQIHQQTYQ